MGLLDNTTQQAYYQGNNYGNYQFTSLEDIINQFIIAYTGENKIIPKIKRTDVAFHAQRAMQELSFDTFKSIKSQEIVLPPSNTMILPHDYVNYTRVLWTDSSGIKHPLYPTKHTQNPFKIKQDSNQNYDYIIDVDELVPNSDFSSELDSINDWNKSSSVPSSSSDTVGVVNEQLEFLHNTELLNSSYTSRHHAVWEEVNVDGVETITITADGLSSAPGTDKNVGTVRIGLSTLVDFNQTSATVGYDPNRTNPNNPNSSRNGDIDIFNLLTQEGDPSYIEFNDGLGTLSAKTVTEIDVSSETTVFLLITSDGGHTGANGAAGTNVVDNIIITPDDAATSLQSGGTSTTWSSFSSGTSSGTSDIYDLNIGQRYGLEPSHAQNNGSYFIDDLRGLIHFSSNCSGKTIVLDYISDSLGTDREMQVHKFAEEAMYKSIAYAICSTTIAGQQLVPRFKKEKFAAIRQAKLRLSNIKLEEITQILRGKSKWIKH
jgi:hypothetical protein